MPLYSTDGNLQLGNNGELAARRACCCDGGGGGGGGDDPGDCPADRVQCGDECCPAGFICCNGNCQLTPCTIGFCVNERDCPGFWWHLSLDASNPGCEGFCFNYLFPDYGSAEAIALAAILAGCGTPTIDPIPRRCCTEAAFDDGEARWYCWPEQSDAGCWADYPLTCSN